MAVFAGLSALAAFSVFAGFSPVTDLAAIRFFFFDGALAVDSKGAVYFGANDGKLYAFDGSGQPLFSVPTAGRVRSSPAIGADGTVYVGSDDGFLYAIGP